MLVLANRDLELSCDAAVVRLYGAEARAPYARTLLELEALRANLGSLGHNALLGFERGEGWPDGT